MASLQTWGCDGIEFIASEMSEALSKKKALEEVILRTTKIFSHACYFLIVGHEAWQPNNRIVRYKKLWKSIGTSTPPASDQDLEWPIAAEQGIRFFGVMSKSRVTDDELIRLLKHFKTAWMLVVEESFTPQIIMRELEAGWEGATYSCPPQLLKLVRDRNAVLARDFGPDDEMQNGAIAIGTSSMCRQILHAVA